MADDTTEKQAPPILVAAFKEEAQLLSALASLEERRIGRDFIGVLVGEGHFGVNGGGPLHLLSVLAPRRLHPEIRDSFSSSGAEAVGDVVEMRAIYRTVPHPGALEHYDMKLPMGLEYQGAQRARRVLREGGEAGLLAMLGYPRQPTGTLAKEEEHGKV